MPAKTKVTGARRDVGDAIVVNKGSPEKVRLVLTIGHSTLALESFIQLLRAHGVKRVLDVRTVPRSQRNPQFNRETLRASLSQAKIRYTHLKELGGLRHPRRDSLNTGWCNSSFRGFADYMQTSDFAVGLAKVMKFPSHLQVALMCAEAVPWRCHRTLIADALLVRGVGVEHILSPTRRQEHRLTPFARAEGTRITYPPESCVYGDRLSPRASAAASSAIIRRAKASADGEQQKGSRGGRRRGRSGRVTPT
jgi:hypothetical protein